MAILERVNIVPCWNILNITKNIINNYIASNQLIDNYDEIYITRIITKQVLLKLLVSTAGEFGISFRTNDMCVDINNTHIDRIISILKPDLESTLWNMCRNIVDINPTYIDISIIGNNIHIYTCCIKENN